MGGASSIRLSSQWLVGEDFSDAELKYANLSNADLFHANLSGAFLWIANLSGANLNDADLRHANLTDADLRLTDLSDAKNLIQEQLDQACGNADTKLPEGLTLKVMCKR